MNFSHKLSSNVCVNFLTLKWSNPTSLVFCMSVNRAVDQKAWPCGPWAGHRPPHPAALGVCLCQGLLWGANACSSQRVFYMLFSLELKNKTKPLSLLLGDKWLIALYYLVRSWQGLEGLTLPSTSISPTNLFLFFWNA